MSQNNKRFCNQYSKSSRNQLTEGKLHFIHHLFMIYLFIICQWIKSSKDKLYRVLLTEFLMIHRLIIIFKDESLALLRSKIQQ